jgi:large conductance mechanosensitive channel
MAFLKEFKEFAIRGNVIDMAVGITVGAAFTSIVNSFVKDILTPPLGLLTGGIDFSNKVLILKAPLIEGVSPIAINYGLFINALISFLIVSFAIFLLVKQVNRLRKNVPPLEPTEKTCPFCLSNIPLAAKKCKFCTSDV